MLSDDVRQKAADKLNVLGTGAIISGLERRIDIVLSILTITGEKLSEGTLARLEAAERARLEAAATEALLKRELGDSLKIKTELFDTCKKLARQLQAAQRGLSEGEKEQEQAKLKDNEIQMLQAEKEALEAQVKQAWKVCQDQADLNTAIAAELKVQAIAAASQENHAQRVAALEAKVSALKATVHELETAVDIKDDGLRQAHVLLKERDKELEEIKPLLQHTMQLLEHANKQLEQKRVPDPPSDATAPYGSQDFIKKLRQETNSNANVMKHLNAALGEAESRARKLEEQVHASRKAAELESRTTSAATEKISALEAQCMYYQQQLQQERADKLVTGAHNAQLQGGCEKCAQSQAQLALVQAASRRAESAAEAAVARHTILQKRYAALVQQLGEEGLGADGGILALEDGPQQLSAALRAQEKELEQLRTEHERHAHAYRDISDEVSRLRFQLSVVMPQEDDAPRSNGGRSSHQALSAPPHHKIAKNPPISYIFPSEDDERSVDRAWCPQGDLRGANGDMPGWCAPERELKRRQGGGSRNGERVIEGGGSGSSDPLVIFSSFNFANPLSWGRDHRTDPAEDR